MEAIEAVGDVEVWERPSGSRRKYIYVVMTDMCHYTIRISMSRELLKGFVLECKYTNTEAPYFPQSRLDAIVVRSAMVSTVEAVR